MSPRSLVLLLALAVVGCSEEEEVGGRYLLVSFGGEDPPIELGANVTLVRGSLEVTADSIFWFDTMEFGTEQREVVSPATYSLDGGILRGEADGTDHIPDDFFSMCAIAGIYRVEDDGDVLRMIDVVYDGEGCGDGPDGPFAERVYRRF